MLANDELELADPMPRTSLPPSLTSFIGRKQQVAELLTLLNGASLLTLVGSGGIGKTRLALEVARRAGASPSSGVALVELAALNEDGLVPPALAAALRVSEQPGRTLTETLEAALAARQVLIVLDNCEHVIAACASLVYDLLRTCPGVRFLATSREPLGIDGEIVWPVPPLSLPGPTATEQQLAESEAVQLFVERARASQPHFVLDLDNTSAIVAACRRLEGIPLAVELAAARVKVLSVGELVERLDDSLTMLAGTSRTAPARQRTLRATLDWSYRLLSEDERSLLSRISVFAGGWSLQAVESVCSGRGIDARQVFDLLTLLIDRSLVLVEGNSAVRYRVLEPVRQYAHEKLDDAGEVSEWHQRHALWCLALARELAPQLAGPAEIDSLDRVEAEYDNLRSALAWAVDQRQSDLLLELSTALWRYWHRRGKFLEGCQWLERAVALADDATPIQRGTALNALAQLQWFRGDYAAGTRLATEARVMCEAAGDTRGTAWALLSLGNSAYFQGDTPQAVALLEACVPVARNRADKPLLSLALSSLGRALQTPAGEHDARLQTVLEESLTLALEAGSRHARGQALNTLGDLAWRHADHETALAHWREAIQLRLALGDAFGTAGSLGRMALAAARAGQPELAASLFGAAEAQRDVVGVTLRTDEAVEHDRSLATVRASLSDAAFASAWEAGQKMALGDVVDAALGIGRPGPPVRSELRLSSGVSIRISDRELQVLRLVADGRTNRQIAETLVVSPLTVKRHLDNVFDKLGVSTRAAAAAVALRSGLV